MTVATLVFRSSPMNREVALLGNITAAEIIRRSVSAGEEMAMAESMKAISLYQPWAWLMVNGYKDIENRNWKPKNPGLKFRGRVLVHASLTLDEDCYALVADRFPSVLRAAMPTGNKLPRGGIVGEFEIVDCVTAHRSPWFFGPYGFVVRRARPLPFIPMPGRLGFFDVPDAIARQCEAA